MEFMEYPLSNDIFLKFKTLYDEEDKCVDYLFFYTDITRYKNGTKGSPVKSHKNFHKTAKLAKVSDAKL